MKNFKQIMIAPLKYYLAVLIACVFIFNSCKKKDNTDDTLTPAPAGFTPAVTAVGTAVGTPNSAIIDASGGAITSADGRLEIIIPANALNSSTTITIQPITNETPGGAGVSYRLTPDGQQFNQPVTIRFHYDSTDVLGTDIHAFGIAFQKADNIWYSFVNRQLDSAAATVSVYTTHFTDWSLYETLFIYPRFGSISVNNGFALKVRWVDCGPEDGTELQQLREVRDFEDGAKVKWSVNGIAGGSLNYGIVYPTGNSINTIYTAPASSAALGPNHTAAVTAQVEVPGSGKLYLTSTVFVMDAGSGEFTMTIVSDITGSGAPYCAGRLFGYCYS